MAARGFGKYIRGEQRLHMTAAELQPSVQHGTFLTFPHNSETISRNIQRLETRSASMTAFPQADN